MSVLTLPPWKGEFGWEVMTWVPWCRRQAQGYDRVIASSFDGMQPLYADFVTEFHINTEPGRSLEYPKRYRLKDQGDYIRYGRPERAPYLFDVLIHGRGIRRKAAINYRHWPDFVAARRLRPWTIGWIGTAADGPPPLCGYDLRDLPLQKLMDVIAASKLVVGVSSGLMHLAAACGTDLVVWGDRRTYFGETLEQRYKVTWNPHNVRVGWLAADDWQPQPQKIIDQIERMLQ